MKVTISSLKLLLAALSLAALAAESRMPVGLVANGALPGSDQPLRLLPGRSPEQIVRILELLAAVTPFATAPIEVMVLREAPAMPWGSTIVVVTAIAHDALLASGGRYAQFWARQSGGFLGEAEG